MRGWEPPDRGGSLLSSTDDLSARSLHAELMDKLRSYSLRLQFASALSKFSGKGLVIKI
jgi:hypothetical protein